MPHLGVQVNCVANHARHVLADQNDGNILAVGELLEDGLNRLHSGLCKD